MARVVKKVFDYPTKCGCCGWKTNILYSFEGMEGGLCADCFMELIVEEGYEVVRSEDK